MWLENKGELDIAIADYNAAISARPEERRRLEQPGPRLGGEGDHDKAIADYNEAIRPDL